MDDRTVAERHEQLPVVLPDDESGFRTAPDSGTSQTGTRRLWSAVALIVVGGLGGWLYARHYLASIPNRPAAPAPIPVTAATITEGDIDITLDALGTGTSLATVTVVSQISGQLMRIAYTEGQDVKKGDLLIEIDSRPYQLALAQAQGALERDQALLQNADLDLKRSAAFAAGLLLSTSASAEKSGPAIAAQQAASVISTAPAPPGDTIRRALERNEITYANVWADDKGQTHVTKCVLKGLEFHAFAPPAAPYVMGIVPEDIESIVFSVLPAGWFGDWHHAPGPQWVITLSGQWEVQTTDGSTLRQGPGEFQFNSDESSFATVPGGHLGHTARLVGSVPNVRMIITLKKRPGQSYTNQSCVL